MRVLCCLFGLLFVLGAVVAQTPIPNRPDGYASPSGGDGNSPVVMDIFVDLLCPDSAAVWPTIGAVISSYKGQVRLVTHLFPLPYHTWAFLFSQGAFVVDTNTNHNLSAVYNFFDFSFNIQSQFSNQATAALSSTQVIAQLSAAVEKAGISSAAAFTAGLNNANLNWDARVAWKYACSRAATGTPTFHLNGVFINADTTWTVADWQSIIDPLLAPAMKVNVQCESGQTECEYLPGQYQCCTAGEMCIKNVG